jgi:hypothetical protein
VVRTDTRNLETRSQEYVDNILKTLAWSYIIHHVYAFSICIALK